MKALWAEAARDRIWCGRNMAIGAATLASPHSAGKRAAADIDACLKG